LDASQIVKADCLARMRAKRVLRSADEPISSPLVEALL
jgi:hypothetical protein